jgi:hypothetical protein
MPGFEDYGNDAKYLNTEAMLDMDAHLHDVEKRRKKKELVNDIIAGGVALAVVAALGVYGLHRHSVDDAKNNAQTALLIDGSRCGGSAAVKQVVIDKADLPQPPTDESIAAYIAPKVPGAESCDGDPNPGTARFSSFIAMLELIPAYQDPTAAEPLTKMVSSQVGQFAILTVPKNVDPRISS